jgi:GAF domain-containing protein
VGIQPDMGDDKHCRFQQDRTAITEEGLAAVLSSVDLKVVVERAGQLIERCFGATRASIVRYLSDPPGSAEVLHVIDPHGPAPTVGTRFKLSGSLSEIVVANRGPVLLDHLDATKPRFVEERVLAKAGYGAVACFPLVFK